MGYTIYRDEMLQDLEYAREYLKRGDTATVDKILYDLRGQIAVLPSGNVRLMTDAKLSEMIEWCRKKIDREINKPYGYRRLDGKELDGYRIAMKAVMSYLHSLKGEK